MAADWEPAVYGQTLFGPLVQATPYRAAGGALVHVIHVEPGEHALSLEQSDSLGKHETIEVAPGGASVHVDLWQRQPWVVPLRPVYRRASLVGTSGPNTELWRLDPTTGQLSQVTVPGLAANLERQVNDIRSRIARSSAHSA